MILVERDRSAIKNLHDGEVMQVSGAPGQLRSNSNFRWSQAPSGTPLGQKWGWPHKFVGPDFGKLAPQTGSGAGAKLRSNDTFFGRSQLAPEPAPESAPRLNVPTETLALDPALQRGKGCLAHVASLP